MKARPQSLTLESLEDRSLLSTCTVTNLWDVGRGRLSIVSGQISGDLRFCINHSNNLPGPDVIDFTVTGTINLKGALPTLTSDIDIQGPGADLLTVRRDSSSKYRIFTIAETATILLSGLSISNGSVSNTQAGKGGGIYNLGVLTVSECTIRANRSVTILGGHAARGGGIYNEGDLTVIKSLITDNYLDSAHYQTIGGGIYNVGSTSVYDSTISNNTAAYFGEGSGVANSSAGWMVVLNTTFYGNETDPGGSVLSAFGSLNVISHSTIAGNSGGIYAFAPTYVRNTIVANNYDYDVYGTLTSSNNNLISNTASGSGFGPTDILNVDPLLGPLQDNGGPTPTMALLPGSPAIDAGENTDAPEFDQRGPGFPRIVNGTIDIGAFEVQATGAAPSQRNLLAFLITANTDTDE